MALHASATSPRDPRWTDLGPRAASAAALIVLGMAASAAAFVRWMANERAMRRQEALPGLGMGTVLAGGIAVIALGLVLLILL